MRKASYILFLYLFYSCTMYAQDTMVSSESSHNKYDSWDSTNYKTGETPKCFKIAPVFDYKLNNFFKIQNISKKTDAVIKLIRKDIPNKKEATYRIHYIERNTNYFLKNIPAGKYFLKIAYGSDWKEDCDEGNCKGLFTQHKKFEKGGQILDFYPIKTEEGKTEIPNYQMTLDVDQVIQLDDEWYYHDFDTPNEAQNN